LLDSTFDVLAQDRDRVPGFGWNKRQIARQFFVAELYREGCETT
jgi:hypothetical protein